MTYKTTTTLLAAMTLAFAGPAFANQSPPADETVQTDTTIEKETVPTEDPLLTKKPAEIESEVAGEVTTSDDLYAPTLSDSEADLIVDENETSEPQTDDVEVDTDVDEEITADPEGE